MKQTSELAVQPRRNILTALGVWVVGLWSSTKVWASPPPPSNQDPELTMVIGRLCIDPDFRKKFFDATVSPDQAINNTEMVRRNDIRESLKKVREATKPSNATGPSVSKGSMTAEATATGTTATTTTGNTVGDACGAVYDALYKAGALMPCNPWPC